MTGTKQIIRYLGQYTHRIAISNERILQITEDEVLFQTKDYRDNGTVKNTRLSGVEFLRRFAQHILPKGFVRIRRYGIYNARVKRHLGLRFTVEDSDFEKLIRQQEAKEAKDLSKSAVLPVRKCPYCKTGNLIRKKEIPRIRSPAGNVLSLLKTFLQ